MNRTTADLDTMKPEVPVPWRRATRLAAVWICTLTTVLVAVTLGVRACVPAVSRNSPIVTYYVLLLPVILLSYLLVSTIAARVHRSSRVTYLVGIMGIPGMVLTVWVWLSQFNFWDGGP